MNSVCSNFIQLFTKIQRPITMKISLWKHIFFNKNPAVILFTLFAFGAAFGQSYMLDMNRDSARSDTRTGGVIEKTNLVKGDGDVKITVNVPAFQMTLWQNGKEVKSYPIGIGLKDYPIYIGYREAKMIIWNPVWIPPSSDWVEASSKVEVGEIILPTDPRNPLGKMKIPLGYGYLLHQARSKNDLGNLVSHGCVRVMQDDLYDLSEKIIKAREVEISDQDIAKGKRTKETIVAELQTPLQVELTYDTMVVEAGVLHIYPDIYDRKKNTAANLREELKANEIDVSDVSDKTLEKMISFATAKKQYVVSVKNLREGNFLGGKAMPVL